MSNCMNNLFDFGTIHGVCFSIVLVLKCFPRLKPERYHLEYLIFQHGVTVFVNTKAFSLESQLFTIGRSFEHQNEMPFFFSFIGINFLDKDIRSRNCIFGLICLYLFHWGFFMAILKGKNYMYLVSESER